jgi:hypothetical protein
MMSYVVSTMSAAASCAAVTTSLPAAVLPPPAVAMAAPRTALGAGLLLLLLLLALADGVVVSCGWPEYTLMDRPPGTMWRCSSSTHCNVGQTKRQTAKQCVSQWQWEVFHHCKCQGAHEYTMSRNVPNRIHAETRVMQG